MCNLHLYSWWPLKAVLFERGISVSSENSNFCSRLALAHFTAFLVITDLAESLSSTCGRFANCNTNQQRFMIGRDVLLQDLNIGDSIMKINGG